MTPQQKELILLWTMITTRTDFSPSNPLNTPETIVQKIAVEYNAPTPGSNWNWDKLTPPVATNIVANASSPANKPNFAGVKAVFAPAMANGWPGGGDHPLVSEVKTALNA